jgi:hypothetical protein
MKGIWLLLAVVAALAGCAREDEAGDGPGPTDGGAGSAAEDSGDADGRGGRAESGEPGEPASTDARDVPQPLPVQPVERVVPADVAIGALEDQLDGPDAVIAAVEELFAALAEDRIPSALLVDLVREQLENRLAYMLDRAAVSEQVRIGALSQVTETTYRAPVVAFGRRGGRTTGEIYVANSEGTWYISDILVDFTRIVEDAERPIFEPGSAGPALF